MFEYKNLWTSVASIAVLASASGVMATRAVAQDESSAGVDTIVVTATKRETNLQDTPIAISAYTADMLSDAGVADIQDIDTFTPGLFIGGNASFGSSGIGIRGIGSTLIGIGGDEAVGIYVDGVFQGRGTGAIFELVDAERVEVLRGPQGTLYGRNATGGAINVVTIAPGDEFQAKVTGEVSNLDGYSSGGYVAGPLIEGVLAAKLSAGMSQIDGFQYNPVLNETHGDTEKKYFSGALRWTPTDAMDFTLRAYSGNSNLPLGAKDLNDGLPLDIVAADFPSEEERKFAGVNLTGAIDLGGAELTAVLGYVDSSVTATVDSDASSTDNVQFRDAEKADQYSAEIRLASTGDGPLSWIAGVYYFDEAASVRLPFNFFRSTTPIGLLFAADIETEAYAAFGEVSYDVSDRLKLTGGLRYSYETKDWLGCIGGGYTLYELDYDPTACEGAYVPDDKTFEVLTPRFVLDYAVTDDVLAYASATRGFRSGGWNFTEGTVPDADNGFDEEFVWSYEVGTKTTLMDGRARLNLAGFYMDYQDLQVRVTDPATSLLNTSNAATAGIYGIEAEFDAAVTDKLDVTAALSWLDAKYDSFAFEQTDGSFVDYGGNRLNRAPEWNAAIAAEYELGLGDMGSLFPRIEWQYVSEIFHNETNTQPYGSDAFELINLRARLEPSEADWMIEAFVENATDEQYRQHSFLGILPSIVPVYMSPPRVYGIRFSASF